MARARSVAAVSAGLCLVSFLRYHAWLYSSDPALRASAAVDEQSAVFPHPVEDDFPNEGDDGHFRVRPSIVLFGDSITQLSFGAPGNNFIGWGSLLASAYSRRADVLNRGFSGYNTQLAVDRLLPEVFTGPASPSWSLLGGKQLTSASDGAPALTSPLFCTVLFGTNDMAFEGERQHVPINQYKRNLVKIVEHIQSTLGSATPIVLLTPPPFSAKDWMEYRGYTSPGHSNLVARSYGFMVKQVANEYNLALLDTWMLLEGKTSPENYGKYMYDGMHPNESGNRLIFNGIMAALKERYPHVLPMSDGKGKYGTSGIPYEEELWERLLPENAKARAS